MKRPTWSSLTREAEAFLSALREMGSVKSAESKTAVVKTFGEIERQVRYLKKNGTLPDAN